MYLLHELGDKQKRRRTKLPMLISEVKQKIVACTYCHSDDLGKEEAADYGTTGVYWAGRESITYCHRNEKCSATFYGLINILLPTY